MIFKILILLLSLSPLPGGFTFMENFACSYVESPAGGVTITLSWTLTEPGAAICIYRGGEMLHQDPLPGDTTGFEISETEYGTYQYSVGYFKIWPNRPAVCLQWETVILQLGKLRWDPVTNAEGYIVYVSTNPDWYYTADPYFVEGHDATLLPLEALIAADAVAPGTPCWVRVAAYREIPGGLYVSDPSSPVPLDVGYTLVKLPWERATTPAGVGAGW